MSIPFFDYVRGYERMREEVESAMRRTLSSGRLILGPEGEAFEHEFAAYVGARSAVAVGSGTDAIAIALRALEIGSGDEVLTVSHTAVPTVGAIREVGARPRFVDIDDRTLVVDPRLIAARLTPRTRAIVLVHLYGAPVDVPAVLRIAAGHGVPVIEDCAQAHGARVDGRHVGTWGTIGCFSFYPTKNLGAYGDGGLCVTQDAHLAQRMRCLRFHGYDEQRLAQWEGVNSRLDELQAAILRVKLRWLPAALRARQVVARRYLALLAGADLRLPECPAAGEHAWHLFVVRSPRRSELIRALRARGIGYGIHYERPVHLMPAYERLGEGPGSLPVTERAVHEILSLPMFPELTEEETLTVCQTIRQVVGSAG